MINAGQWRELIGHLRGPGAAGVGWSVGCKEAVTCKWPWATVGPRLQAVRGQAEALGGEQPRLRLVGSG